MRAIFGASCWRCGCLLSLKEISKVELAGPSMNLDESPFGEGEACGDLRVGGNTLFQQSDSGTYISGCVI